MTDAKNVLNGVQNVVLDLDGTIYDKRGIAGRMVKKLWWCLPVLAAERLARRNAHYVQFETEEEFFTYFFRTMARGHWWTAAMAEQWYRHVYLSAMVRIIARYHQPRPEVMALIEECRRRGIPMAVYSDYGSVDSKLEALGVDPELFVLRVSAPELGALKPSAACAEKVLEMLGAKGETTLFVGDREEKDGESAKAVGARFLLIEN